MQQELKDKTLAAAIIQVTEVLTQNWDDATKGFEKAYSESDPEAKFKFNIGLGVKLTPKAEAIGVYADLSFTLKHSDSSMGQTVDMQPTLL